MSNKKIAINICFGSFDLSPKSLLWLYNNGCNDIVLPVNLKIFLRTTSKIQAEDDIKKEIEKWKECKNNNFENINDCMVFTEDYQHYLSPIHFVKYENREDPLLIRCIESLKEEVDTPMSQVRIIEIPEGVDYQIANNDGYEYIREKSREWKYEKDKQK